MLRYSQLCQERPAEWTGLDVPALASALRTAETRERAACDTIMRALLAPGGVLGAPTPAQGYLCAMRGMCALDTLGVLQPASSRPLYPQPPPGWSDDQLLEWLLVDNWHQRADTWLKLVAFAGATGRNFYTG